MSARSAQLMEHSTQKFEVTNTTLLREISIPHFTYTRFQRAITSYYWINEVVILAVQFDAKRDIVAK